MADAILPSKFCRKCKNDLPISNFAKSSGKSDGLQCWCKACRKQYRLDNIELYKERDRKAYLANTEHYKNLAAEQRKRLGKDGIRKYNISYYEKNKEISAQKCKEWREKNKDYVKESHKKNYQKNKEKFYLANKRKWLENPHIVLEACRKRTAAKNNAIPKWANRSEILRIYKQAQDLTKETGILHQVDHIVPIQSKLVSGLHVEHNLQVITLSQNAAKGNRWWPDMP